MEALHVQYSLTASPPLVASLLVGPLKRFYDTMPFCRSFKDYDGEPIQVTEQKDAYEFGTMLFDKLECSHPDAKALLSATFGGTVCYSIVSLETGEQLSERVEPFLILTAEVKNKSNLEGALELYTKGETLSGDNQFQKEDKSKVDAVRRCADLKDSFARCSFVPLLVCSLLYLTLLL